MGARVCAIHIGFLGICACQLAGNSSRKLFITCSHAALQPSAFGASAVLAFARSAVLATISLLYCRCNCVCTCNCQIAEFMRDSIEEYFDRHGMPVTAKSIDPSYTIR
jgi:hypothetical protein